VQAKLSSFRCNVISCQTGNGAFDNSDLNERTAAACSLAAELPRLGFLPASSVGSDQTATSNSTFTPSITTLPEMGWQYPTGGYLLR